MLHSRNSNRPVRVSFILTTRNKARFIGKALEMIRLLVKPEDELIVVDGGSSDGTVEILARYSDLVDVLISEKDSNASHALNKGILLSKGLYIKHLTDDDQFFPDAMEQAIKVLEAHPEVDMLLCGGEREVNGKLSLFYVPPGINYGSSPEDVFRYGVCGCGIFIRRSAIPQVGLTMQTNIDSDGEHIARAIYYKANVKFCRIKLFYHPIYEHSYIILKRQVWERDMDWNVRQYCSLPFYLKHRVKNAILRNPSLGRPALVLKKFILTVFALLGSQRARVRQYPNEPIWDGGFS